MKKTSLFLGLIVLLLSACKKDNPVVAESNPGLITKSNTNPQQRGLPVNYSYIVDNGNGTFSGTWAVADLLFGAIQYVGGTFVEGERAIPSSVYTPSGATTAEVDQYGVVVITTQLTNMSINPEFIEDMSRFRAAYSDYINAVSSGENPTNSPALRDYLKDSYGGHLTKTFVAQTIRTYRTPSTFALVDATFKVIDRVPD
ncbi:hypothetical protein [Pedobacter aquatilis]|uniref:hypothetical protein n=1 Tax=Pedobacter aquatilis TaxID=351343 RepID=UPI002930D08C|nr:hypothetical protein [Pedobacter aquatilis]